MREQLGTKEVGKLTGLSAAHIRRLLIANVELHGVKVGGWVWVVRRSEVERFKEERKGTR